MELLMLAGILVIAGGVVALVRGDAGPPPEASAAGEDQRTPSLPDEADPRPSIAVLPFDNLSPDPDNAYFADGVHEEIIAQLAKIGSIRVISRNSVMQYRQGTTSTPAIASDLGVGFVLEGSVRKDAQTVRLTAQLIDARTDAHLWVRAYDRDLSVAGLFEIQTDVARRVAEALEVRISALERGRIGGRPTESAAAYDLYLRATQLSYGSDPAASAAAEELLEQALELDPGFADARAALSQVYFIRAYNLGGSHSWADSGLVLARRVIEQDPGLGSGYRALGFNYVELGRLNQAEEAYRTVLNLQPSDGQALFILGWIDFMRGNLADAVALWGEARAIDPMNATIPVNVGVVHILFGNHREARGWLQAAEALAPDHPYLALVRANLLRAEGRTGDALAQAERYLSERPRFFLALETAAELAIWNDEYDRARRHFEQMRRTAPEDWNFWGLTYRTGYGHVLLELGESGLGNEILDQVLEEAERRIREGDERAGVRREIAAVHAVRGDTDLAYEWLARAIESGWRHERFLPSPLFERLRGEDRFEQLMGRIDADIRRMEARVEREDLGPDLP